MLFVFLLTFLYFFFACMFVSEITRKAMNTSFWNFYSCYYDWLEVIFCWKSVGYLTKNSPKYRKISSLAIFKIQFFLCNACNGVGSASMLQNFIRISWNMQTGIICKFKMGNPIDEKIQFNSILIHLIAINYENYVEYPYLLSCKNLWWLDPDYGFGFGLSKF